MNLKEVNLNIRMLSMHIDMDIISLMKILYVNLYIMKNNVEIKKQNNKYIDKEPTNSISKDLLFKVFFNAVGLNNASKTITSDIILTIMVVTYKK